MICLIYKVFYKVASGHSFLGPFYQWSVFIYPSLKNNTPMWTKILAWEGVIQFGIKKLNIRDLQEVQLEILLEFHRICRKHGLKYQLYSGTLLGAVRHGGFIPWDDDIDVCMLREDYNRFLQICKTELGKEYFLQTHKTDREFIHVFARIRKNNTLALQELYTGCNFHHGIFIDVFPIDNIMPGTPLGYLQRLFIYPIRELKYIRIKKYCLGGDNLIKKILKLMVHHMIKVIPKGWTDSLEEGLATIFQDRDTEYASLLTEGEAYVYHAYMVRREDFYKTIDMEFEGHYFPVPGNYDEILTRNFGDYMDLPPVEEQKPHHGIIKINTDKKGSGYICS